jgi:hypothetical protein
VSQTDWSREIGEKHGRRDRNESRESQALIERTREHNAATLERWPAVVAAMRAMVASYNAGAGLDAVTLVEDTVTPGVTLEATGNGRRSLVIALDDGDVCVRTRHGHSDPLSGPLWVSLDRTDADAAAYLLRDWMERL